MSDLLRGYGTESRYRRILLCFHSHRVVHFVQDTALLDSPSVKLQLYIYMNFFKTNENTFCNELSTQNNLVSTYIKKCSTFTMKNDDSILSKQTITHLH